MEITSATATSLGEKLAGLDLDEHEGALLAALLGHGADAEVAGFGQAEPSDPRIMFETFRKQNLPSVLGPLPGAWKQPGGDGYLVITMTN